MHALLNRLPWFNGQPISPRRILSLAPRRRTYRCLLLDGVRRDPVTCSSISAEEAAKTVAWEALTEERFCHRDEVTIRVHILGEAEERRFHFTRHWNLSCSPSKTTEQAIPLALAG